MNASSFLLSRMVGLFGARPLAYCAAALVGGVLGVTLLTATFAFVLQDTRPGDVDPLTLWRSLAPSGKLLVFGAMIFGVWTPILLAARGTCRIASDVLTNRPTSLATTLADMATFIPAALVYSVVIGLGFLLGGSLMFAPGICFIAAAGLVVPAGVMESKGTVSALGRGLALATKVFGRALLVVLGSAALMIVVMVIRPIWLVRSVSDNTTVVLTLGLAWLYIPGLLVLIFANICFTLLYLDACASEVTVHG